MDNGDDAIHPNDAHMSAAAASDAPRSGDKRGKDAIDGITNSAEVLVRRGRSGAAARSSVAVAADGLQRQPSRTPGAIQAAAVARQRELIAKVERPRALRAHLRRAQGERRGVAPH